MGPKRLTFEIGPKRPAPIGPKRLTPNFGPKRPRPKRPDRTGNRTSRVNQEERDLPQSSKLTNEKAFLQNYSSNWKRSSDLFHSVHSYSWGFWSGAQNPLTKNGLLFTIIVLKCCPSLGSYQNQDYQTV